MNEDLSLPVVDEGIESTSHKCKSVCDLGCARLYRNRQNHRKLWSLNELISLEDFSGIPLKDYKVKIFMNKVSVSLFLTPIPPQTHHLPPDISAVAGWYNPISLRE